MRASALNHVRRSLGRAIVVLVVLPAATALGAHGTQHRKAAARGGRKPGAVVHRARSHSIASATMVLLGDMAVEWQYDLLPAGQAEAFRVQAGMSGPAGAIHAYVSGASAAGTLVAGLYSSVAGHPGTLLSAGSTAVPRPGAWNEVPIAPVELRAGTIYWLAILGRGGVLRYRDRPHGPCQSKTSAWRDLRALPRTWRTGSTYSDCPVSAFVTAAPVAPPPGGAAFSSTLTLQSQLISVEGAMPTLGAPAATELPVISGDATEGQVLVVSTGSWIGSPSSFAYQWEDCNTAGEACAKIGGAGSATYKLAGTDVGHTLRVVVTASNAAGSTKATSAATTMVLPIAPSNTVPPSVSGSAEEGQKLSASTGAWSGSPTSFAYQWQDCNTSGGACANVSGATSASYKLAASDVGHTLRVVVTATNAGGLGEATSVATATVTEPPSAPTNTVLPSTSGSAVEGQLLSASTGTWTGSPTSYTYEWDDCDTAGKSCSKIMGATSETYKLAAGDDGDTLRVGVTASNVEGSNEAFSVATETVVPGTQIDVTQAGAGSQTGEDCANAHSLAWLNAEADWGAATGKVKAGTTVSVCGTLTEPITVAGSGRSGDMITLRFQPGARISMPACPESGCIDTAEHTFLNIEGASESERGVIENTDQGTGRKEEGSAVNAHGIEALDCEGCTIRYMNIENLYVKTSEADTTSAEPIRGIEFSGSNLTIAHNTLNYVGWALYSEWNREDKDVDIEHNTITHIGHGFASTAAFTGGDIGPISFHGNRLYGFKAWDTVGDPNHQDGVHCYSSADQVFQPHYSGLYIYDNRFGPETGKYMNASIFIEGPAEQTQCADGSSNIWIFDNVSVMNEESALGGIYTESGEDHIFNNTIIGPNTVEGESKNPCILIHGGERVRLENNIASTCDKLIEGERATFASGGLNYNLYANGGGAAWICGGEQKPFAEFSYWKSCTGQDANAKAQASAGIKVTPAEEAGKLETGSPAKATGTNLTGLCEAGAPTEALCQNIDGEARPSSGAWNIGAY